MSATSRTKNQYLDKEIDVKVKLSEGYLLVMAVWMAIPSLMVIPSITLKAGINRWANLVIAILSLLILGATFFVGEFSIRDATQVIVEAVLIVLIIRYAWHWPKHKTGERSG